MNVVNPLSFDCMDNRLFSPFSPICVLDTCNTVKHSAIHLYQSQLLRSFIPVLQEPGHIQPLKQRVDERQVVEHRIQVDGGHVEHDQYQLDKNQ